MASYFCRSDRPDNRSVLGFGRRGRWPARKGHIRISDVSSECILLYYLTQPQSSNQIRLQNYEISASGKKIFGVCFFWGGIIYLVAQIRYIIPIFLGGKMHGETNNNGFFCSFADEY